MIRLVLLGLLACASAAPYYHLRHGPPPPFPRHDDYLHQRFFKDDIFDTRSFWDELRKELMNLDSIVEDFAKHFPSSVTDEQIIGNTYRVTIPLSGFDQKDIIVKAKKGLVMIQAVHHYGESAQKSYIDMRSLPDFVNENGDWSYKDEVLKLSFPLSPKTTPSTETETDAPYQSREEMETHNEDENQDADVVSDRGDLGKETELLTNEVPRKKNVIEATTYAIDLKDEVEFVPIRQVK